jgi:hypothetical protein
VTGFKTFSEFMTETDEFERAFLFRAMEAHAEGQSPGQLPGRGV